MRLVFIGLMVAAAIWVLIAGLRNKRRVSFLALAVLLIPAGTAGYFEYKWEDTQNQISKIVQKVIAVPEANLECQRLSVSFFDAAVADDVVSSEGPTMNLKYGLCSELLSWYSNEDKQKPTEEQIKALHLLSREAMRVAGQQDASLQACLAVKNMATFAEALGATKNEALYMQLYYQQNIYPDTLNKSIKQVYC